MFRKPIAVLVAAASLGVAASPVVPAAHAAKNTGKFQRWLKSADHARTCANLRDVANFESDQASDAYAAGDKAGGAEHSRNADQTYNTAVKAQCSWAT